MSSAQDYANAMSQLLMQRAGSKGRGQQGSAHAWGNFAQSLPEIAGQTYGMYDQSKWRDQQIQSQQAIEDDRRQQTQDRQTAAEQKATIERLMQSAFTPDPETGAVGFNRQSFQDSMIKGGQGAEYLNLAPHLDALEDRAKRMAAERRALTAETIYGIEQAGNTPEALMLGGAFLKQNQAITQNHLDAVLNAARADGSPEFIGQLMGKLGGNLPEYRALKQAEEKRQADLAHSRAQTANLGGEKGFNLSPGQVQFDQYGGEIARVPAAEKPPLKVSIDEEIREASRTGNGPEMRRLLADKRAIEAAGRAPSEPRAPEPLETIIGPDGKPVLVRRSDAVGMTPGSGTEKQSSGVQKRVLNFFNRARQADDELEGMEADITKLSLPGQTQLKYAPNFMQTQLGQSYGAAQRAFTEARLRKDSGAAIPPQEFANDQQTYFQQPGDSAETLNQKRRARAAILASLAFESGQALGEFVGDPNEAKALVESYKQRASVKPPDAVKAPKPLGPKVVVTAPDGSKHPFDTQAQADEFKRLAGIR